MKSLSIIDEGWVNKWTRWYFANDDNYYQKVLTFLTKNYIPVKGKRKSKNLLHFRLSDKMIKKNKNFKKAAIFFSKNRNNPTLFLQMERLSSDAEKQIDNFLKKKIKIIKKEQGLYYYLEFGKDIEINKRKIAEEHGIDYDTMHYKSPVIYRPHGAIMVFLHRVKLLSYDSMKSLKEEKEYVRKYLAKNLV